MENVIFSMGVKWTMITVRFGLIVVQRVANIGFIYFALAYHAKMKMKKYLLKSQNIIIKDINITSTKSHGQSAS